MIVRLLSYSVVVVSDMVAVAGGQRTILDRHGRNGRSSVDEQLWSCRIFPARRALKTFVLGTV